MTVRVCADDDSGSYSFRCPVCRMTALKAAEPHVVDLLAASGVRVEVWTLPLELRERPTGGALFTHDDLLDFHDLLGDPTWFDELTKMADD
ncbi:MAG: hypothetical protein AAGA99_20505 [Actinomycetota bacterium]